VGANTGGTGNEPSYPVLDLFLLLLIGMGPKTVLVPFLDVTKGVEPDTQRKIANTLVRTAAGTALPL
jgi:small neutral amino acid transporter SnatA (MarC family)